VGVIGGRAKRPYWTGLGMPLGAGLGFVVGLLGWGSTGIALGLAFGASIGLIVGAIVDSLKST
jgi:hypothetical protein